ncbi:MAG: NAD(P)-binding protein [Robiginitomaculum sp.]
MKILVLGADVIGVTTAYALGRQGHEVVIFDKANDAGRVEIVAKLIWHSMQKTRTEKTEKRHVLA